MSDNPFVVKVNDTYEFEIPKGTVKELDLVEGHDGQNHVLKNGHKYKVNVLEFITNKEAWVEVNGNKYKVSIADKYDQLIKDLGLTQKSGQKQNQVKSPMPGLVLDVKVEAGQSIEKGETLLILEAMKMENVIKAGADGKVKKILVNKGQAVEKGAVMIEME